MSLHPPITLHSLVGSGLLFCSQKIGNVRERDKRQETERQKERKPRNETQETEAGRKEEPRQQ